jgi:hypothetical protein
MFPRKLSSHTWQEPGGGELQQTLREGGRNRRVRVQPPRDHHAERRGDRLRDGAPGGVRRTIGSLSSIGVPMGSLTFNRGSNGLLKVQ